MSLFRFVHTADLHLDTPFAGIGRIDPAIQDALRDASLEAWDNVVELTIDREAAFLVLAGDIYDGAERGLRAQLRFLRGLEKLAERGIAVFIVHGNHDPLDGWSAIGSWPAGVTVFGADDVGSVAVEREGVRIATVYGMSYPRRDVTENLALRFHRETQAGLHLGLLHCTVGNQPEHLPYSPCTPDDLRAGGLDYWALGHVHRYEVVSARDPWVVYSGSTQGRSPKPSELGAKGAVVAEVANGVVVNVEHVPTDEIRFARLELEVSAIADLPSLRSALVKKAEMLRAEQDGRSLLLRAELTGRCVLHRDLRRPGVTEDLLRDLREEASVESPFLWWEDVRDSTWAAIDRDAVEARGDFSAELLRSGKAISAEPGRIFEPRLGPIERGRLRKWVSELEPEEAAALLRAAEDLALDLLEEES